MWEYWAVWEPLAGRTVGAPFPVRLCPMKTLAAAATLLLGAVSPALAQGKFDNHLLNTESMAGQQVAVLPVTYVLADPAIEADSTFSPWAELGPSLRRADSLLAEALTRRAPEVNWVLPPALRRLYRRAPGMLTDPDRMGQSVLRSEGIDQVPGNLNASLRKLTAMTDGRLVLVPAAVAFGPDSTGQLQAALSMALVDARRGTVVWRSRATGLGASPDAAFKQAASTLFPVR